MAKVTRQVKVMNELGLHARPAGKLVNVANRYKSEITLEKDNDKVNAKSILSVLSMGAGPGSSIVIIADGEDAEAAVNAIEVLFTTAFVEGSEKEGAKV